MNLSIAISAARISLRRRVSPPIRQAFPVQLLENGNGALIVAVSERLTVVVAEVKLVNVALQVLFAHALVNASEAALEDREESFNRVRRDDIVKRAAHVFVASVRDALMLMEVLAQVHVRLVLIGVHG